MALIKGIKLELDNKKVDRKTRMILLGFAEKCFFAGVTFGWKNKVYHPDKGLKEATFILEEWYEEHKGMKKILERK